MNFFNFFDWDQKYECLRHHFQYLAQFTAPRGGSEAVQIFSINDYGNSFAVVSTTKYEINERKFEARVKKLKKSVRKILKNVLCSKSFPIIFFCSDHAIFSIILPLQFL